ncbi:MAG: dTMP kinase [Thermoplasmatales archaeon B_DKE]|nr:MAG: dTMP kinase [Thermoplasmatales archaeon B_DKE]QRF75646.1 putative thymidylate kinase [Thermoplasmatales archaeon]
MFIAIEGIDGSGKTTISRLLSSYLNDAGFETLLTREPTDAFRPSGNEEGSTHAENGINLFFQFTMDRFRHQFEIEDAVSAGKTVICDRYLLSSYAYQGPVIEKFMGSRAKTIEWMENVSSIITVRPDITIYLRISPATAMKRIASRKTLSGFENREFLELVHGYYEFLASDPVITLDAESRVDSVFDDLMTQVQGNLGFFH